MSNLDIGKSLEENKQRTQHKPEPTPVVIADQTSTKSVLILVGVVLGFLLLFIGGFATYNHFTGAQVVNVDELHKDNLKGDLNEEEGYVYNGFSIVKADGLWWTEVVRLGGLLKVPLRYGPQELENVSFTGSLLPLFNAGDSIYIAIDPSIANKYYSLAISELSFNMAKGIARSPIGSCTKNDSACDNRTIINCDHTQNKPVLELSYGGDAGVEMRGTCIKLTGQDLEIVRSVDRLLYQWYGVME